MDFGKWPPVGVFRAVPLDPVGHASHTVRSRACDRITRDDALFAAFCHAFSGPVTYEMSKRNTSDVLLWLDQHPDRYSAFADWYTQRLLGPKEVDGYPIVYDMLRPGDAARVSSGVREGSRLCIVGPDNEIRRATVVDPRVSDSSVECSFAYRGDDAGSTVYRLMDETRKWHPLGFLADGDYSGARCVLFVSVFHATIKETRTGKSRPPCSRMTACSRHALLPNEVHGRIRELRVPKLSSTERPRTDHQAFSPSQCTSTPRGTRWRRGRTSSKPSRPSWSTRSPRATPHGYATREPL